MSVIPVTVSLTNRAKAHGKSGDIPGTANITYGYRLGRSDKVRRNVNFRYAEQSHSLKCDKSIGVKQQHRKNVPRVAILPVNSTSWNLEDSTKEERDIKNVVCSNEFQETTNRRIMTKNIRRLVDEGMAAYEDGIAARREKLRSMILAEEATLTREIIDQAQRGADWRMDDMRKRSQDLRNRLEEKRLATVAEKRMQQYLDQCPEVRDKFSRKTTRETKYSNLVQITENEAKRQAEREVDEIWYELMMKDIESKKAREIEEEKQRAVAGKDVAATLEKQMAGKLTLTEEEKRVKEEEREDLERILESVRQEELSYLEKERRKRANVKKDLEEQLLEAKRRLAERAQEEATKERMYRDLGEAELAREKAAIKESASRLRGEIIAYLRSLEELREEETRRNAEVEAFVEASAKKAEAKHRLERKKSKENQARILRQVLEGREQQLRTKRATDDEENKQVLVEGELLRKEAEVEAALMVEAKTRRRETAFRYGQELKAQQKHAEKMRQRENEENERMHRVELEKEEEYQKLTEQLLNAPEIITPHAFKILLKECETRRDAEQKGLCNCSPPPQP